MTPILFLISECSKLFCSELLKEKKKWKLEHEMEVTGCVISGHMLVTTVGDNCWWHMLVPGVGGIVVFNFGDFVGNE